MRPNILVFMTDQQRGDTIYPYSRAITPNIKRFCNEGLSFSNAYTVAPHCCPSRATFFSGLYPSQHGVWNNVNVGNTLSRGLYDGVRLFSEDLKDAGYTMNFSGKWHVSAVETPWDRGFQKTKSVKKYKAMEKGHKQPHIREWKRYEKYTNQTERGEGQILRKGYSTYTHYGTKENPFKDSSVVDEAVNIIKTREKSDDPWFHFVGTLGPHDPYFLPEEYLDLYDINDIELPKNFNDYMKDKPALYRRTRDRFDQLTEREHREAIRHYLAFCTYEDALFGKILDALEESGEKENTLVIYLSDHGDYMAEHGLWCKGLPCFNGAYHIPVAMRWPQGIKNQDRIIDDNITLADFAPTMLELADIETDRKLMGYSLVPYMKDVEPKEIQDTRYTQSNGNELYGIQRSVSTEKWKFVYNGFDYDELYDLENDPDEVKNLINESQYEDVIREMSIKLWKFAKKADDVCINDYIMVGLSSHGPGIIYE